MTPWSAPPRRQARLTSRRSLLRRFGRAGDWRGFLPAVLPVYSGPVQRLRRPPVSRRRVIPTTAATGATAPWTVTSVAAAVARRPPARPALWCPTSPGSAPAAIQVRRQALRHLLQRLLRQGRLRQLLPASVTKATLRFIGRRTPTTSTGVPAARRTCRTTVRWPW